MFKDFPPFVPDGTLADKVILITGASQGIGLIAAYGFARAGATVALGARRGDVVAEHAAKISEAGGKAVGLAMDVTDEQSVKDFVDAVVRRFGRLDGAFNNAGMDPKSHGGLVDIPFDEWKAIHAVKIDGTYLSMKYEIPYMLENGKGSIVNNGSVVSERTPSRVPAPSSSQSAITGMTRSAASAYGHANIRVNMLATGLILTPERVQGYYKGQDERMKAFAPMQRPGTGEDVSQVAAWLLSDFSAYVNGAVIPVDGGHLAGTYQPG
jgi:NAD(P)-dependent dehydrogenase (short-subunit alcohol dehydrogenase family)